MSKLESKQNELAAQIQSSQDATAQLQAQVDDLQAQVDQLDSDFLSIKDSIGVDIKSVVVDIVKEDQII